MNFENINRPIRIGDVYLVRFNGQGCEQKGWRPGVVFQNNLGNTYSPNLIILPLTSSLKKQNQPTHVLIPADENTGLLKDSMVLCENPEIMSKDRLGSYLTTLPKDYMAQIAIANLLATSAIAFLEPDMLLGVWQKSLALNTQTA